MQEAGYFEFKLSIDKTHLIVGSGNQIKIINLNDLNQEKYQFDNLVVCFTLSQNNNILIIQDVEQNLIIQNLETDIAKVFIMKQLFNQLDMRGQDILYCFDHDCHIVLLNPFRQVLKLHSGLFKQHEQFYKLHLTGVLSPNNRYIFLPGIDNKIKIFRRMNQTVNDYLNQL
ncbi:hypothetical protein pb186bvf_017751 [Paramecium bursaria]